MDLKYLWTGIQDDDTPIVQWENDTETTYSTLQTQLDADNVKEAKIVCVDGADPNVYTVDLVNYKFYRGTVANPTANEDTPEGITGTGRAELIYKRRNQVRVDETGTVVQPARTTYILGFKIGGTSYTCDVRAAVGQLAEEYVSPRVTDEEPL